MPVRNKKGRDETAMNIGSCPHPDYSKTICIKMHNPVVASQPVGRTGTDGELVKCRMVIH